MFNYFNYTPGIRLTTARLLIRLIADKDAVLLAGYYQENRAFLEPWEPIRDDSYRQPHGWRRRCGLINTLHKQGSAFYFALFDPSERQILGVANFSGIIRGAFHACYLGYSLGEKWQGQGLMFEALDRIIHHLQRQEHIHRIMANYMPHNQRSGKLLKRLGFEKEGFAKNYLLINGVWRDHVLTALTDHQWVSAQ